MPDFQDWLSYGGDYDNFTDDLSTVRAILAWGRISAKPATVSFKTSSGTLAAQTVRLESDNTVNPMVSVAGQAPKRRVIVFGIRDHPSLQDTIIDEGYTFNYFGDTYVVRDIILTLGEVQGISEALR